MKTLIKTLGFMAVLAFAFIPMQIVRADDDANNSVSFQTFYDQLSGQGNWIQTSDYGYVFQPTVNDPNWRPYTYGHWVSTDQGMMWDSDEPFGWATYHYGRWVDLDNHGWVWVPGYTWAPAWVSWRDSDDDVGWAPLPPDTLAGIDYSDDDYFGFGFGFFGFHIGDDCDLAFGIGPWCYNFCPVAFIGDRDCWRHFRDHRDNFALINHTRNVTNLNVNHNPRSGRFGQVRAGGPSVAALNARSRTPIQHASLTSASTLAANGRMHGNSLSVFAPNVNPSTGTTARPHSVSGTLGNASVNRGMDINKPLAVNSGLKPAGPTADQIHAATLAQGNLPAGAKVATANTHISRQLTQPLTAFHPNTTSGANVRSSTTFNNVNPAATTTGGFRSNTSVNSNAPHETTFQSTAQATHHAARTHTYSSSSSFNPFSGGGSSYHPSSVFHTSSAPAFHPQSSFHSFAPSVQHFGGGAPAMHFGGGGGGGGGMHFSGGGGGGGHNGGGNGGGGGGGNGHH